MGLSARDDLLTVSAIAILAAVIATVAHEAAGHGSACLAMGGHITELTNVYFDCSVHNILVPAGGPFGNLIAALLAWLGLRTLSSGAPRLRLLFLLVMGFDLYWIGGYFLYSAFTGEGDNAIVARILAGGFPPAARVVLAALGLIVYRVALNASGRELRVFADGGDRVRNLIVIAFVAASVSEAAASAFFAPDRLHSIIQGTLEIGAASVPMLFLPSLVRPENAREAPIPRSPLWMIISTITYVAFVATLGRGLP